MTSALLSEVGRGEVERQIRIPDVPLSPEEVGARIVSAREDKKPKPWSQFDLALALGVSPSTIYRWEKGKLPSMNELIRLAEVLDKSPDYLTEPPERRLELADLHRLLEELLRDHESVRADVDRGRAALLESLESIDARLSAIEGQLGAPDVQPRTHP